MNDATNPRMKAFRNSRYSLRAKCMRTAAIASLLAGGSLFDACSAHWHYAISNGGKDFLSQLLDPANYIPSTTGTTATFP